MMPGYNRARVSFLFFGFFVSFGTFFLMSVVIAVVCNAYNASMKAEKEKREAAIEKSQSEPPRPGFRVAASNKSKVQKRNKRNRKK